MPEATPERRRAAVRLVPAFVVLAAWFAARQLVLGTPVGGYTDLRARFLSAPVDRAGDFGRALRALFHPAFGDDAGLPARTRCRSGKPAPGCG